MSRLFHSALRHFLLSGLLWFALNVGFARGKPGAKDLKVLLDLIKYDERVPPCRTRDDRVQVSIGIYINWLDSISELNQDYTVNLYLRQRWTDFRLNYAENITSVENITLTSSMMSRMWIPDPFFENGKAETFHDIPRPNSLFVVYKNGTIFYSQRLTVKLWCSIAMADFPMDNQTCYLRIMTYRYSTRELKFSWMRGNGIKLHPEMKLQRFQITNITNGDCTHSYSIGDSSCIFAAIHLTRQFGFYVIQLYVPSMLVVLLSWISFWLDVFAVPARITLGALTILAMSTHMTFAVNASLPQVSYIKAVDIWVAVCVLFVFAALVEFAVVNTLARREIPRTNKRKRNQEDPPKLTILVKTIIEAKQQQEDTSDHNSLKTWHTRKVSGKSLAQLVDYSARIIFPLLFAIFIMTYWVFYLR